MKAQYIFPPFMPDQSNHSEVLLEAKNVYPAIDGFRPVKAFSPASTALTGDFRGGGSFISSGGTSYLLAGTESNLYKISAGAWVSLVGSLSVSGRWRFTQFGDYAIAVNGVATRVVDLAAGTDGALSGAPTGNSVTVVGDHVVISQPNGNLLKVRWSAFGDHTGWTNGTNQAGENEFYSGGEVMGLAGGEYGLVFQRQAINRMSLTGDSEAPFQFDEITSNFGCASKASIIQEGRTVFWLSQRGFMAIDDGQALRQIGSEKVDRTFIGQVSSDDYERIWAAVDPNNKLVMWGLPGPSGQIWIYNWELDRWSQAELSFNGILSGYTSSLTLEQVSALYSNIDTMTLSLDDPSFSGGSPQLYVFNGENKLGTLSGVNLKTSFRPGFFEPIKGRRTRINGAVPITDATSGLTLTMDCRERLGDAERLKKTTDLQNSGVMPVRCSGQYVSPRLELAAGTSWSFVNGVEIEYQMGGNR